MRTPQYRNDRMMLVTMSGLVGLGLAVGLSLMPPVQLLATDDASAAANEFAAPGSYTTIAPTVSPPPAHSAHKRRGESKLSAGRSTAAGGFLFAETM